MDPLDDIPLQVIDVTLHRYGSLPDDLASLQDLKLQPAEIEETLALLRTERSATELQDFFESPFRIRKHYKGPPLRFSDARLLALYGALERQTAEDESARDSAVPYYKDYCTCRFAGMSKDLRGAGWTFLVGSGETDLQSCQTIAHQAHASGAQALLAPSARRNNGTCVPVFDKNGLSEGRHIATVRYEVDGRGHVERVVVI